MKITNIKKLLTISGFIVAASFQQNTAVAQQKNDPKFNKMMADSFRAQGIAGLDRIVYCYLEEQINMYDKLEFIEEKYEDKILCL